MPKDFQYTNAEAIAKATSYLRQLNSATRTIHESVNDVKRTMNSLNQLASHTTDQHLHAVLVGLIVENETKLNNLAERLKCQKGTVNE